MENLAPDAPEVREVMCDLFERTPIRIGDTHVHVTGSMQLGHTPWPVPDMDVEIYLDPDFWHEYRDVVFPQNPKADFIHRTFDGMPKRYYVAWPWGRNISVSVFEELVGITTQALYDRKLVEVGSSQNHGRIGTLLAGLLVKMENMTATEAIREVGRRICPLARGTELQEAMIYRLRGQRLPKRLSHLNEKVPAAETPRFPCPRSGT